MKIFLARHGETEWNKERKMQGRANLPLNDAGIKQAETVAERIQDIDFDLVFSSPLKRAEETARIIGRKDSVIIDERLIEMDFGVLEGHVYKGLEIEKLSSYTEKEKKIIDFFVFPDKYTPLEGGESYEEIITRVKSFLDYLEKNHSDKKNILVVSHATSIHVFLAVIDKIPLKNVWDITIPNSSISIFEYIDKEYKLIEAGVEFH